MRSPNEKQAGIKAVPFFALVQQFAFMAGLPFFSYNDQKKAIAIYMDSLQGAE